MLLLVAAAVVLAWRQYDDGKRHALSETNARVVLAATVFDTYFAGELSVLRSVAASPPVLSGDAAAMSAYFRRVQPAGGKTFTGGLGWIDLHGQPRATSNQSPTKRPNAADRQYFQQVLRTRQPFISGGLVTKVGQRRVIVMAVPTFDRNGRLTGVLAGGLKLRQSKTSKKSIDLGFEGLVVIDRDGQQITLRDFARPANRALLARMRLHKAEVLADTRGLAGSSGRIVAYATSAAPGWIVALDRSPSQVFGAARRALALELASIVVAALLAGLLIGWAFRRARREEDAEEARTRIWSQLARSLAEASTPVDVAEALSAALSDSYPGGLALVALPGNEAGALGVAAVRGASADIARGPWLLEPAAVAYETGEPVVVRTDAALRERFPAVHRESGGLIRSLAAGPIINPRGRRLGAVALLSETAGAPNETEIAAFAEQAVQALTRSLRQEQEHEAALMLQRSLLPAHLPAEDGVTIAARYHAAGSRTAIGGDWYDAVRRPDGILHVSVGDVAGHGIPAATLMAQLRNAFRAYSLDHDSPAEITRRMLRHVPEDAMATMVCLTIDPYTGRYAYSLAGHPPPLLLDVDTGEISRLDAGGAPPLGLAEAEAVDEQSGTLPAAAALVVYTDGLVERRDASIERGIGRVEQVLAASSGRDVEAVADEILTGAMSGADVDDDAALVVISCMPAPSRMEIEVPANPAVLATLRRRLEAWLTRRGLRKATIIDAVLATHEACINAIEHGYRDQQGTIRLRLEHDEAALHIRIEDRGRWRPPRSDPTRGRGALIMRSTMESATIEPGENGTRVTLRQPLTR